MPLRKSLHVTVIAVFLGAIFVAILWQGAPGYRLQGNLCFNIDNGDGGAALAKCCKDNPGDGGCKGFQTGGDNGSGPAPAPAPAPAPGGSASSCSQTDLSCSCPPIIWCLWGGPICGPNGTWTCPNCPPNASCGPNRSSASNDLSSSSSSTVAGPAPAPAPAPAPSGSSVSSAASSAGSSGGASSSSSSTNNFFSSGGSSSSSSTNPGPAPVPPQCPRTGFCDEICTGSFPNAMQFTVPTTQGQCSADECQPIGGSYMNPVIMTPDASLWDGVASCVFSAEITPPTCVPPGTVGDKWVLKIYEDPQDPENFHGFYYSDLSLQGIGHFRGRSPWRCDAANLMSGGSTTEYPAEPVCSFNQVGAFDIGVAAYDNWCLSSSSTSSSSSMTSSNQSSIGASSAASSTANSGASSSRSSSSSSITTSSCDPLICFLGGTANCLAQGFTTCSINPLNSPLCHSCSGVRSSASSAGQSSVASRAASSAFSSTTSQATSSTASVTSSVGTQASSAASTSVLDVRCGDAITQSARGEFCDEGSLNGDPASRCATSCRLTLGQVCATDAQCDSGLCSQGRCMTRCVQHSDCENPLVCIRGACRLSECGDGIVTGTETCDLGSTCTTNPASCNRAPGTAGATCLCDPNSKNCPRKAGVTWTQGCVPPPGVCGNGVLDTNSQVYLNGIAVNGELRREQCDLGASNGLPSSPCSNTCTLVLTPFCGNGKVDPGETCDAGVNNGTPDSGCTSLCGSPLPANTAAGSEFESPNLTPGHQSASYELPLLPVRLSSDTSADLTRLSTSRAPVAQTGPEALLAIAMGAGFGWSVMRKRKTSSK